ncbi:hypothetical protein ACLB6G_17920 [Zhengella sp. ZM62]|uniref:hypothetical protein n=1 Tax=Zhengella sedimenti TaxID=3390035 RepID=UPI0039767796
MIKIQILPDTRLDLDQAENPLFQRRNGTEQGKFARASGRRHVRKMTVQGKKLPLFAGMACLPMGNYA